jgi:hypothetical protein
MSSVIVQLGTETAYVVDEIVIRRATTHEACERFLERFGKHRAGVNIYGDASGFHAQTTGRSDYEVIREYFQVHSALEPKYRVPKANPPVRDRVTLTNRMLRSAAGDVNLLVDPRCKELIKDFEQVCYKSESTEIDKDRDRLRTHTSDALGYLLWQECRQPQTAGEKGQRLI